MCQLPWSLVRHAFLELHQMMPADRPWQAGAGLLGLFASTYFRPFLTPLPLIKEHSSVGCVQAPHRLVSGWCSFLIHTSDGLGCIV